MATATLDRERESLREADEPAFVDEEELAHRAGMAAGMRFLRGEDSPKEAAPIGAYAYAPRPAEPAAPAMSAPAGTAPAGTVASRRLADYVPITTGMQGLRRMGDSPEPFTAPASARGGIFESVLDSAVADMPAETAEPSVEANVYEGYAPHLYEAPSDLYETAAPQAAAPAAASEEENEDSMPTRRTMEILERTEAAVAEHQKSLLSALSTRTKLVLATVVAVIMLLLTVVCVNTAIINSINADVSDREQRLTRLKNQKDDIDSEIDDLTSPENVDAWALAHGMTK